MASQRNTLDTPAVGRTDRNNGMTTVGPLTVTMAPNRADKYASQFNR